VDGLLVVASLTMVDDRRAGRRTYWVTRLAFWLGLVASLGANVLHADPSATARIVAAWPSLALLLTVEVLAIGGRGAQELTVESAAEAAEDVTATATAPTTPSADLTAPAELPATDLAAALDRLGIPRTAGRPTAQRALRDAGVAFGTAALTEAIKARKAALNALPSPQPATPETPTEPREETEPSPASSTKPVAAPA
jgi:hypothetical protein